MQKGMALIMEKHRNVVRNFNRSNVLMEIIKKHQEGVRLLSVSKTPFQGAVEREYERRFYELADLVTETFAALESQHSRDIEVGQKPLSDLPFSENVRCLRRELVPPAGAGRPRRDRARNQRRRQGPAGGFCGRAEQAVRASEPDLRGM